MLKLLPYAAMESGEILGLLFLEGKFFSYTMYRADKPYPPGIYQLVKHYSPHFHRDVLMICNVPGHDHMYFHIGNKLEDTKGCVLHGAEVSIFDEVEIHHSADRVQALEKYLFPKLDLGEKHYLEVKGIIQ